MMSALGHDTEAENRALAARNDALQLDAAQTLNLDAAEVLYEEVVNEETGEVTQQPKADEAAPAVEEVPQEPNY